MKPDEGCFIARLENQLGEPGTHTLYPCIRDLIQHGLDPTRFASGERTPQRQDVTQYLAAWCKHAGLTEEEARCWMLDYCVEVLAPISSSTPAAIRHSTKSNLRYIYKAAFPFFCGCSQNPFKAECNTDCPFHARMQVTLAARASEAAQPSRTDARPSPTIERALGVKESYQQQFQKGLALATDELSKGTKLPRIVRLLNDSELKTRTGRLWNYANLHRELQKLKSPSVIRSQTSSSPEQVPGQEAPQCSPGPD